MSVWTMLGGPVFWLLIALGVTSVLLFFNRLVALRRAQIDYVDFVRGVGNVLEQNNPDEALALCDETPVPVARIVAAAVRLPLRSAPRALAVILPLSEVNRVRILSASLYFTSRSTSAFVVSNIYVRLQLRRKREATLPVRCQSEAAGSPSPLPLFFFSSSLSLPDAVLYRR